MRERSDTSYCQIPLRLDVAVRDTRADDLPALEWFGLFKPDRKIIRRAFRRQERGTTLMLIASIRNRAVGQVWLNFDVPGEDRTAELWALRVIPWLEGLGVGSELLRTAERVCHGRGCAAIQLKVERSNGSAQRLYRHVGYVPVRQIAVPYSYRRRDGARVYTRRKHWLMRKALI